MNAAVTTRYAHRRSCTSQTSPRPAPGAGELPVRVHATTVNRTDCGFRAAHHGSSAKPKRTILGNEFAGVVEPVGANVTRFAVGG
jgi:NADPH:quinone reductase-like Zn-dependent oxidoreductase